MINARAESIAEKPSFRGALKSRRCLILADGYYEWTVRGKRKVPVFFHLSGNAAFAMAGLWERWKGEDGPVDTCAIITTAAGSRTVAHHHRMPALLTLDGAEEWLNPASSQLDLEQLLVPYEREDLEVHEVSVMVNSPANDRVECIEAIAETGAEYSA